MLFVAFYWSSVFPGRCLFWFLNAFACSLLFYLKNQNGHLPFVARYRYRVSLYLMIALFVVVFCAYQKPQRASRAKKSKWKRSFKPNRPLQDIVMKILAPDTETETLKVMGEYKETVIERR